MQHQHEVVDADSDEPDTEHTPPRAGCACSGNQADDDAANLAEAELGTMTRGGVSSPRARACRGRLYRHIMAWEARPRRAGPIGRPHGGQGREVRPHRPTYGRAASGPRCRAMPHQRRAHVRLTVTEADTAISIRSGDLPVPATSRLVGLCEEAACAALAGTLGPGGTSVGTWIELEHLAPSVNQHDSGETATRRTVELRRPGGGNANERGPKWERSS